MCKICFVSGFLCVLLVCGFVFFCLYNMGVISVSLGRRFVYCSIAGLRSGVISNAANKLSALQPLVGDERHF